MPTYRHALDAVTLDDVLSLDLDRGVASLDLARVAFVDAYALTGLACFVASAARDGLPVRVVLPEDPDVRSWLSRMHFGDVLEAFDVHVVGELPRVVERDRSDALIELQRFKDAHGSDRLASFIWERLEGGADGEVVNQLFEATGELGANVVEHAGSPSGGFVTAQRYKAGTPDERIIVAVGDVGIGIRESLRPRYGDMSDDAAIRRAVQWHVSRVPDEGRGQGLPGDLSGTVVMVDCSALQASTPSFVDELVKAVLVDRRGNRLVIKAAPERTVELARRAAQNRGVLDRLEIG